MYRIVHDIHADLRMLLCCCVSIAYHQLTATLTSTVLCLIHRVLCFGRHGEGLPPLAVCKKIDCRDTNARESAAFFRAPNVL